MKILALDTGDVWTGTALSDPLHIVATPFKTVETKNLYPFLTELLQKEDISTVVLGHPITMKGTKSDQTKKVEELYNQLQKEFNNHTFVLWDERLTSKQADSLKKARTPEQKQQSHSIAAAYILQSYLQHLEFKRSFDQ